MNDNFMKAARLHAIGDFRVDTVPVPTPNGAELLVRIGACGVCGSDIPRIYVSGTSKQKYPLTIGHEFSGTVVAVGADADPTLVGKRGAFFPLIPCRRCDSCLSGNYAMCEDYEYMGSRRDGGFAEYCLVPSAWNFVESHNADTPMTMLAMAEPACVAQHAVRKSSVYFGANVLIFGAGPIGIMAGRWAKLAGAAKVLFSDVVDAKVEFCKKCGFDAVNSRTQPLEEVVRQTFRGRLADVAIEGTGYGSALNQAITCIRPFGTITLLGNPAADTTITKACHSQLLRKEATIHAIWNSHYSNLPINEWRYTVDQMDSGAFDCTDLISHTCSLDELPEMTAAIHEHRIDTWKVLYTADSAK